MTIAAAEALTRCIEHREIFHDEMLHLMRLLMRGELSPQIASALLMGLRVKKETVGEITAAAQVMREFHTPSSRPTRRTCWTCAARAATAAIPSTSPPPPCSWPPRPACRSPNMATAARPRRRAAPTLLEALGANLQLTPEEVAECVAATGIGFMFAPAHHGAMKNVAAVRKELGVRTIFKHPGAR